MYEKTELCNACSLGKQIKCSFKSINIVATTIALQLLHTDLLGPTRNMTLVGKEYYRVIVDDYSRFT